MLIKALLIIHLTQVLSTDLLSSSVSVSLSFLFSSQFIFFAYIILQPHSLAALHLHTNYIPPQSISALHSQSL